MKIALIIATFLSGIAPQAFAASNAVAVPFVTEPQRITVSCFRGPWNDVIWDRPNSIFVDDLVALGYDFPTAHAIAERICRDDKLVGNPPAMGAETLRVVRESPEYARRRN